MSKFVFTCWDNAPKFKKFELCDFMIYQKEECPKTRRIHYQGYIEFKNEYKLYQVKSLFKEKKMFVDAAKESRAANILYCTKSNTYVGGRFSYNDKVASIDENRDDLEWDLFMDAFNLDQSKF